jgi:hypothetical protein
VRLLLESRDASVNDWLLDHLPEWIAGALVGIAAWFAQRAISKVDAQEERIAALERKTVTKDDFDELRESMTSTFVNGMQRLEMRQDQILFHMAKRDDL